MQHQGGSEGPYGPPYGATSCGHAATCHVSAARHTSAFSSTMQCLCHRLLHPNMTSSHGGALICIHQAVLSVYLGAPSTPFPDSSCAKQALLFKGTQQS